MNIAVIVLNYCTPELTLECLASLESEVDPSVRVIVVDNASGDGSGDQIERAIATRGWDGWARLVRAPINGGFAFGNNLGIRTVEADAYLLLNSDTLVLPGAIAGLRDALHDRPDAGIVGPRLLDGSGAQDHTFFRALAPAAELIRSANTGPVTRVLKRFDPLLPDSEEAVEPDWIAFASVLIRREVIDQVGLLDEGYFMYFEDVDYCRRVREAGWKIVYWPHVHIVHYKGASSHVTDGAKLRQRAPRYYYEARSRYFTKFYGKRGLWLANSLWHLGRCVSWPRELLGNSEPQHREHESRDIWIDAKSSTDRSGLQDNGIHESGIQFKHSRASHGEPNPIGPRNQNPAGVHLLELLAEDFRTHDRDVLEPGFWAVALHRLGNARMGVRSKLLRAPLSAAYQVAFTGVSWLWGIDLSYDVKLGRRVRIWHHGGILLNARSIGDDVHIRHNTTLGIARRDHDAERPIIGNGVDLGVGSCVLGAVTVGDGAVIGANSVVVSDVAPHATAVGAPARPVQPRTTRHEQILGRGSRQSAARVRLSETKLEISRRAGNGR
jgi:N-acetylglucosaminyl-diphospho-decaprenol L-rhamnosyltransferase